MNPIPTGRLVHTAEGRDLVLTRTFRAPIEDVWASITEPERTARWFAGWTGEAGPGKTIRYSMGFEADGPASEMLIVACEPPRHLAVRGLGDYGWELEAHLGEANGVTELRFVHHLDASTRVSDVGPGWEYYLDNLVASRDGTPMPDFKDYDPAQRAYFLGLEAAEPAST
jgi:uncharacterized protein YndB with AHSA1/START domain